MKTDALEREVTTERGQGMAQELGTLVSLHLARLSYHLDDRLDLHRSLGCLKAQPGPASGGARAGSAQGPKVGVRVNSINADASLQHYFRLSLSYPGPPFTHFPRHLLQDD